MVDHHLFRSHDSTIRIYAVKLSRKKQLLLLCKQDEETCGCHTGVIERLRYFTPYSSIYFRPASYPDLRFHRRNDVNLKITFFGGASNLLSFLADWV